MPAPLRPDEPEPPQEIDHPLYQEQMNKLMQQETSGGMAAAGYLGNTIPASPVMDHRLTVSQQLYMRKQHLEHELEQVNAAIAKALENAPTMALLDSIAKVGLNR